MDILIQEKTLSSARAMRGAEDPLREHEPEIVPYETDIAPWLAEKVASGEVVEVITADGKTTLSFRNMAGVVTRAMDIFVSTDDEQSYLNSELAKIIPNDSQES